MAKRHNLGRAKFRVGQVVRTFGPSWVKIICRNKPHLYLGEWHRTYEVEGLDDPATLYENSTAERVLRTEGTVIRS